MVTALKQRGVPVTYVTFPDEGHGFVRPENRLAFYGVTEAFLAKHLGDRCQPIGNDFAGSSLKVETGGELLPGIPGQLRASATGKGEFKAFIHHRRRGIRAGYHMCTISIVITDP